MPSDFTRKALIHLLQRAVRLTHLLELSLQAQSLGFEVLQLTLFFLFRLELRLLARQEALSERLIF